MRLIIYLATLRPLAHLWVGKLG